jgi:hypothetical protein
MGLRGRLVWLATVCGLVLVPIPALATNFGAEGNCGYLTGNSSSNPVTQCVSRANNSYHAVRLDVVGNQWAGMDTAVIDSLATDYNPLDLMAYVSQTDPYPDVIVYDLDYGSDGFAAWVDCPANNTGIGGSGSTRWCRGQILRFNGSYESQWINAAWAREGLACHELGHTVGLRHAGSGSGCLTHPTPYNNLFLFYQNSYLRQEDKDHINANYS